MIFLICASITAAARVVVFGMAGAGKSSLIRALCEVHEGAIRISSEGEGTLDDSMYDCPSINGTMVMDTPGFGTRRFPMVHSFPADMTLALLVVSSRLYTQHYEFVQKFLLLTATARPPLVLVRSQIDLYPHHHGPRDLAYIMDELYRVPIEVVPFSTRDSQTIHNLRAVISVLNHK